MQHYKAIQKLVQELIKCGLLYKEEIDLFLKEDKEHCEWINSQLTPSAEPYKKPSLTEMLEPKYTFEDFWNDYDYKVGRKNTLLEFNKLPIYTIYPKGCSPNGVNILDLIKEHVPKYIASTPDKKFRLKPENYIITEAWNNEIVSQDPKPIKKEFTHVEALAYCEKNNCDISKVFDKKRTPEGKLIRILKDEKTSS